MELSNRLLLILFAALSILLVVSREEGAPTDSCHGVWRGRLTTVTARGGMLSTEEGSFWVSHRSLAAFSLKGDSLIVFGRRSGMFISPFSMRLRRSSTLFSYIRRQFKNRLLTTIRDPVSRGLTGGLLMGLRGLIPVDTATAFKQSGTSHLLALSGLHTGIIALILLYLARMIFGKGVLSGSLAVMGIVLFVALSGGRASTVRAGIMASFAVLWMTFRGGRQHLLTVWWVALILSLVFLPGTLVDKGAKMSYCAVLSLIVFGGNLRGRLAALYSPLYAGVIITISLAPLMISIYGGISWLGPVATVISLPFMLSVMAMGFLSFAGITVIFVLLDPISHWWVGTLQLLGHDPVALPQYILYPVWVVLLVGLRVFSKWNRFNRRFR